VNATEYLQAARRTDISDKNYNEVVSVRMSYMARLIHAGMGITTEAGEFMDALKKHTMYGRQIDTTNLKEELGDLMWYISLACDELGITLEEVMERNIAKLRKRYPEQFTEIDATNRDLKAERATLEDAHDDGA
jgi:NTP pyrophosphatase (non-canonical NTP hydrolase)